jgi:hypothetical protein
MDFPPSSHFIYIPVVLVLGLVLGFIWGARTTREAFELERRRQEDKARRRAERAAAAAGAGAGPAEGAATSAETKR